ncbi:unnamed protein product, partial [Rotaria sp. Silwood1]
FFLIILMDFEAGVKCILQYLVVSNQKLDNEAIISSNIVAYSNNECLARTHLRYRLASVYVESIGWKRSRKSKFSFSFN